MNSDRLNIANRIIAEQDKLVDSFDKWVREVKSHDLAGASETVKESNKLRVEIARLKKEYAKLNKRSGIILINK